MTMTPRLRKFALTAHITFSVGWLGAIVAYLALAIAGLTVHDAQMVRAAYLSMELIGWYVIVPFSLATLLTGLVLVLLAATTLSVYKPWGMTPYGRRKQHERRKVSQVDLLSYPDSSVGSGQGSIISTPRWVYVVGIHAIGLVLLFVVLHLTGGGLPGH